MSSWILQANPQKFLIDYFLEEYMRHNLNEPDWWVIHQKHLQDINPGDIVYIWKAMSEPSAISRLDYHKWKENIGRRGLISGIIAKGKIEHVSNNFNVSEHILEKSRKYIVEDLGFTKGSKKDPTVYYLYPDLESIKVKNPLTQKTIIDKLGAIPDTDLGRFFKHKHAIRSVPLTPQEARIIDLLFMNR